MLHSGNKKWSGLRKSCALRSARRADQLRGHVRAVLVDSGDGEARAVELSIVHEANAGPSGASVLLVSNVIDNNPDTHCICEAQSLTHLPSQCRT